jgi:esterase/lipase superfamily enzyme
MLKVAGVDEFGVLAGSVGAFDGPPAAIGDERFAAAVNEKLARSAKKDVYIYVHGCLVVFENPVLVAAELWHYLGYGGVFIAYSWPAMPRKLAYFADLESAGA